MNPEIKERAAKNKNPENIWDKMEQIQTVLKGPEALSPENKEVISLLLQEIEAKTLEIEARAISFFEENTAEKLRILFPDNKLLQEKTLQASHQIELLSEGEEAFQKIIEQISTAKTSIDITMFVWRDDKIGNQVAQALLSAANRGVKIKLRKDRTAAVFEHAELNKQSFFHPSLGFMENLKRSTLDKAYDTPGEIEYPNKKENPLLGKILKHPNITTDLQARNDHSKYWIFDNETILTGGMNIGDEYNEEWRDYMLKVKSPLLSQKLKDRVSGKDDFDEGASVEFSLNRVENGVVKEAEIKSSVLDLLQNAQKEVIIEMAYFGDPEITQSIIDAAKKDIDIKIIAPGQANVQDDLNKQTLYTIYKATKGKVQIYLFPDMLHAKVIHVDAKTTFLGSANLNTKATQDLGELNIIVQDKDCPFTKEIQKQLKKDLKKSRKVEKIEDLPFNKLKATIESKA